MSIGVFFAGAGTDGNIARSLLLGESLNQATTWQAVTPNWQRHFRSVVPVAFTSYHSTFNLHHNTVVNFPFYPGYSSSAFRTDDYYITAVDKGLARNAANQLIASYPGYRYLVQTKANWTLVGALWDPHGYWGPAGNFWVYDTPFLTAGQDCQPVAPAGENGLSCTVEIPNAYRPEDTLLGSASVAPSHPGYGWLRTQGVNYEVQTAEQPKTLNSSLEPAFWQDTNQQIVWVRLRAPSPPRQPQGERNCRILSCTKVIPCGLKRPETPWAELPGNGKLRTWPISALPPP